MQFTRASFTQPAIRFEDSATFPLVGYTAALFAVSERVILGQWIINGTADGELMIGDASFISRAESTFPFTRVVTLLRVNSNDAMRGFGGADTMAGRDGNDRLDGGEGNDILLGEAGNDSLRGNGGDEHGEDSLSGGAGDDELYNLLGSGRGTLDGGSGNDTLTQGWGGSSLAGGEGADWISSRSVNALAGASTLDGGVGNDTIETWGRDRVDGGAGADSITSSSQLDGPQTLLGGAGADTIRAAVFSIDVDGGVDGDLLIGGDIADTMVGGNGADTLRGGSGGDSLVGGADGSLLLGEDWADTIAGGSGGETIDGGSGPDVLTGGAGSAPNLMLGGADGDRITAGTPADTLDGGTGADTLIAATTPGTGALLTGGDDRDWLTGGRGAETLLGGAGNDSIQQSSSWTGTASGDYADGGSGNDTIAGGQGADTLIGGAGDDLIAGHSAPPASGGISGADLLVGGAGNDAFSLAIGGRGLAIVRGDDPGGPAGRDQLAVITSALPAGARLTLTQGIPGDPDGVTLRVDGAARVVLAGDVERIGVGGAGMPGLAVGAFPLGQSAYAELAMLALHAYSDKPLNTAGGAWNGTGLRPVLSVELGLGARGTVPNGLGDYSMLNGIYRADGPFGGQGDAVAHVYRAAEGLFIAFRGTDSRPGLGDISDQTDWLDVANHYARLKPLVDAIKATTGLGPIFITGHSLGGSMAQMLHADLRDNAYTVTFGSPGAPTFSGFNGRLTHIELTQDIVPFVGGFARLGAAAGEVLQVVPHPAVRLVGAAIEEIAEAAATYRKPGVTLRLPDAATQRAGELSTVEHDMARYLAHAGRIDAAIEAGLLVPAGRWGAGTPSGTIRTFTANTDLVVGAGRVEADAPDVTANWGLLNRDGDDLLIGGQGADTMIGHAGNDTLYGVSGADVMLGGRGRDVFAVSWTAGIGTSLPDFEPGDRLFLRDVPSIAFGGGRFEMVDGRQVLVVSITGHGSRSFAVGAEQWEGGWLVTATNRDLGIGPTAPTLALELWGGARRTGTAGADTLGGTGGDDTLLAAGGNDLLIGGSGAGHDSLVGGEGQDRVSYRSAAHGIDLDLARGTLVAPTSGQSVWEVGWDSLSGIEHVDGGAGADTLAGDTLANALVGLAGNDSLLGRLGADTLLGGIDNDWLGGDAGNDLLIGGAGADTLAGGAGADIFRYAAIADSTPAAPDLIADFTRLDRDRVDLAAIDAHAALAGNQVFAWRGLAGFTGAGAELRVEAAGAGFWLVSGDVDGDARPDLAIRFAGAVAPAANWFIL